MKFVVLCILAVAAGAASVDSSSVGEPIQEFFNCTNIRPYTWDFIGEQITCFVHQERVESSNYKIGNAKDESVKILSMSNNADVEYLPINIKDVFPNLIGIFCRNSSLIGISAANFEGLQSLKYVSLSMNKLVRIGNDTFDGARSLEWLMLDDNRIEFMHGQALKKLANLKHVNMFLNECVDLDFDTAERLNGMTALISNRCGQCDGNVRLSNCEIMIKIQNRQGRNHRGFEQFVNSLSGMLHKHSSSMAEYFRQVSVNSMSVHVEYASLVQKISAAEGARDFYNKQAQDHNAISRKIQAENNEMQTSNTLLKKTINEITVRIQNQKTETAALNSKINEAKSALAGFRDQVDSLNRKAAELGAHYCK